MSGLYLDALTERDCELIRQWRAEARDTLRTPYLLTIEQQRAFYRDVVSNRQANARYWAARNADGECVAFAGLENISWENGHAEISLLVATEQRGKGIGAEVVDLVLVECFEWMRLMTCWGEVYHSNETGVRFWRKVIERHGGMVTTWPRRKWWNGRLHDADLFTISAPPVKVELDDQAIAGVFAASPR